MARETRALPGRSSDYIRVPTKNLALPEQLRDRVVSPKAPRPQTRTTAEVGPPQTRPTADMERRRAGRGGDGPRDSGPTGEVIGRPPGGKNQLLVTV